MRYIRTNLARKHCADLIESVKQGRAVTITRRGKPVVQMLPIGWDQRPRLPDMTKFRKGLGKGPRKLVATIRRLRKQDRY